MTDARESALLGSASDAASRRRTGGSLPDGERHAADNTTKNLGSEALRQAVVDAHLWRAAQQDRDRSIRTARQPGATLDEIGSVIGVSALTITRLVSRR